MGYLYDILVKMRRGFYPKGRAFKMPFGGRMDALHRAIARGDDRIADDAKSILDSMFPDNENFDEGDAKRWEYNLGIPRSSGVTLADRKAAINRKLFAPGSTRPRQHYLQVEDQLRKAGFDVRIYENRFDDGMGGLETRTPSDILGIAIGDCELDGFELDEVELDGDWSDAGITLCVNCLKAEDDASFAIGDNYRSTFYVAGATITTFAEVPAARMDEFRLLLLTLKPDHAVGILFVNYV